MVFLNKLINKQNCNNTQSCHICNKRYSFLTICGYQEAKRTMIESVRVSITHVRDEHHPKSETRGDII